MSNAGQRIIEGLDEIAQWKAGRTKATVWFDGEAHRMTYGEHKMLLLGQKRALPAGRSAGLHTAANLVEEWNKPQSLKLRAGEMTAGELRTCRAVLKGLAAAIKALDVSQTPSVDPPSSG